MFKKLLFLLLLIPTLAHAQVGQRIAFAIHANVPGTGDYAKLIPNASVYVCTYNDQLTCPQANQRGIYTDKDLQNLVAQPLLADGNGVYYYYIQANTQVVEKVCAPYGQCTYYPIYIGQSGSGGSSNCDPTSDVCSLNSYHGDLTIAAGTGGISVDNTGGDTITISHVCDPTLEVCDVNSIHGSVDLVAGDNITITPSGQNITIAAAGGGSGGVIVPVLRDYQTGTALTSGLHIPFSPLAQVGDEVVITVSSSFCPGLPSGWTGWYGSCAITWMSRVISKTLDAGDISLGYVAITGNNNVTWYGEVTFIGSPTIREVVANTDNGLILSQTLTTSSAVTNTDSAIYMGSVRTAHFDSAWSMNIGNFLIATDSQSFPDGGNGFIADEVMPLLS